MRYEYYIHYFGIDRRNDRWVTEHYLLIDTDEIEKQVNEIDKEEEAQKNVNDLQREEMYLFNNENCGMTTRDVQ